LRPPKPSRNIRAAGIESGPLFRPRFAPHSETLSDHGMTERTMNRLLMRYLEKLPGAMHDVELTDGSTVRQLPLLAAFTAGHIGNPAARLRRSH